MKYYSKIEYPCGFKEEIKVESGFFGFFSVDNRETNKYLQENGCPLHGKKCKKEIK